MKIGYFCNITNWKKRPYTEILDNASDEVIKVFYERYPDEGCYLNLNY